MGYLMSVQAEATISFFNVLQDRPDGLVSSPHIQRALIEFRYEFSLRIFATNFCYEFSLRIVGLDKAELKTFTFQCAGKLSSLALNERWE